MADVEAQPEGVRLPHVWNYGAVERAIREARDRPSQLIFKPEDGMEFCSPQEGYEFYNMYSWERDFDIRYGRSRDNKDGKRTKQDIVCACQGVFQMDAGGQEGGLYGGNNGWFMASYGSVGGDDNNQWATGFFGMETYTRPVELEDEIPPYEMDVANMDGASAPPSTLMDVVASSSNHSRPSRMAIVPYVTTTEVGGPIVAVDDNAVAPGRYFASPVSKSL